MTLIREKISEVLATPDERSSRPVGGAQCGIYAFFDYDDEPIYVGQTIEGIRGRISRHLTGRRSDAVAKFVLDPFEVLSIEVWPMFDLEGLPKEAKKRAVDAGEYLVYQAVLRASRFGAVLNEGDIPEPGADIELPPSVKGQIIPEELITDRAHPDIRIARRAKTIANLAQLISERKVNDNIRRTLVVQAQRLEHLTQTRLEED